MICPRVGVSSRLLYDRMTQVKFAMKDLPTLGMLVFLSMDTTSPKFVAFRELTSSGAGFEDPLKDAMSWMRDCFWRACKDMCNVDREDDLRVLWLHASKERREKALEEFWGVMLLREGIDLEFAVGCLDGSGGWGVLASDIFQAMTELRDASMSFSSDKLSLWIAGENEPAGEREPAGLADLERLDIGGFNASHVLCTMDALSKLEGLNGMSQQGDREVAENAMTDGKNKVEEVLTREQATSHGPMEVVIGSHYRSQDSSRGDVEGNSEPVVCLAE